MLTDEDQKILLERLDKYEEEVKRRIKNERMLIKTKKFFGGQGNRAWLEKHAKGEGLDICSGHIPLGDACGIDINSYECHHNNGALGPLCYIRVEGDDLGGFDSDGLDFIVTNYFEIFSSPLKALNEWFRILKKGGKLAIVCANADKYPNRAGPLAKNSHRMHLQTPSTIRCYLEKVGFDVKELHIVEEYIRVVAIKK
ncbi:MAG: class I SAM-dependent methyltransferase [Promethearchaeota archaeon]